MYNCTITHQKVKNFQKNTKICITVKFTIKYSLTKEKATYSNKYRVLDINEYISNSMNMGDSRKNLIFLRKDQKTPQILQKAKLWRQWLYSIYQCIHYLHCQAISI